jgi:hypothetical protein
MARARDQRPRAEHHCKTTVLTRPVRGLATLQKLCSLILRTQARFPKLDWLRWQIGAGSNLCCWVWDWTVSDGKSTAERRIA